MEIQTIKIDNKEFSVIPKKKYEKILAKIEDLEDIISVLQYKNKKINSLSHMQN